MRSIYKGAISFGLVSVPVKLFGATEDHDIESHQVHADDGGRIRYQRTCEACEEPIEYRDIAMQYTAGDEHVILTNEDKAQISEESNRTIEVMEFVPAGDIDPMLYDKPYYLLPEKGAAKSYTLLTTVLARAERVALVTFAMRSKTRLAALRVTGKQNILVAHTLRWPDEMREPDFEIPEVEIRGAELETAQSLIESLANEFNPDRYRDTYQEELAELIALKAGEPVDEAVDEVEVSALLARLRKVEAK